MAEILTTQAELDAIFKRLERDYGALNKKQQAYAIREIGRIRGELAELLAEFADKDGTIKRQRAARILRELDQIEASLRKHGTIALENIIVESSEWTTRGLSTALGISISAASFDRINEHVVKYVIKRFGDDGLVLSDRIWGLSGEIRDALSAVIRSGIIRGDGINKIITDIRPIFEKVNGEETAVNQMWKVRRLARTESVTAHRAATSYNAQASDIVKWVKFNDGTCGRKDHHKHKCYTLANRDPHGQGAGIYKPTDTEIWSVHPNCTSSISYVLDERWL